MCPSVNNLGIQKVAVVVLSWNQLPLTLECVDSVLRSDYPSLEVILVDNGSSDGTFEYFSRNFPQVTVILNDLNKGFAKGCNQGVELALGRGADYVFLLNNDAIVEGGTISTLVDAMQGDPSIAIAGPSIFEFYNRHKIAPLGMGGTIDTVRCLVTDSTRVQPRNSVVEVGFVSGAALMTGRRLAERGLFDPIYFIYFEDAELNLGSSLQGGRNVIVPGARIFHRVSQAFGYLSRKSFFYFSRGRMIFAAKNIGEVRYLAFLLYLAVFYAPLLSVYSVAKRKPYLFQSFISGTQSGLRSLKDRAKEVNRVARAVIRWVP
jgi:GT2 family glycosyltransferase